MMAKRIFLIFSILLFYAGSTFALNIPDHKGRVTDLAGMLKSDQTAQLVKKLEQYEQETSTQIAILTISSLEGDDLEGFSMRVVEKWKVGQKGKDNGILILVALNDRKMRIEVGRGLEGVVTDLIAGRIVDGIMKPAFKGQAYYKGLDDAINALALAAKGEFTADLVKKGESSDEEFFFLLIYGVIFFIAGVAGFLHFIVGGAIGGIGAYLATSWLFHPSLGFLVIIAVVGFLIGMVAKFVLEAALDMSGAGGFGSSGGSSGGTSFDFGGGGFGGGGASGSW